MSRTDQLPPPLTQPLLGGLWRTLAAALAEAGAFDHAAGEYPGDFASLGKAAAFFEEHAPRVTRRDLDRRTMARGGLLDFVAHLHAGEGDDVTPADDPATGGSLLVYLLGSWLGEWLSWQAQARWRVAGAVDPLTTAEPLICRGGIACVNPFAWARRLIDAGAPPTLPHDHAHWLRCLPPRLLIAADLDPTEAIRFLLPEPGRRAMELEELIGDAETAWPLYREAYRQEPQNLPLLSRMVACAWRLGRWDAVDRLSRVILSHVPDHPQTNHNLAILYSGPLHRPKTRREAVRLLRRAIEADPSYARAYLTLASCLLEEGQFAEAADHARRAAELSPKLRSQAEELLGSMNEPM